MKPWAYITAGVLITIAGLLVITLAAVLAVGNVTPGLQLLGFLGAFIAFLGVLAALIGVIGEGVRIGTRASQRELEAFGDVS